MNKKLIVIFLSLIGTGTAAIMVSGIKLLSQDLNPFIIAFYRCLFGVIVMLPFMIYNHPDAWKTHNTKLQFIRCSINVYSMISWFTAIGTLQLEKAAVIGFTTPLFTTILAIIFLGEIAKELSEKYKVKPHESAAWLDIFSCVFQGIIPHGAQILLVCTIAHISPLSVIGKVYYCYILAIVTLIYILCRKK